MLQKLNKSSITSIFIVMLLVACFLPPISGFSDNLLIPKWIAAIFALLFILVLNLGFWWTGLKINFNFVQICMFLSIVGGVESLYAVAMQFLDISFDQRGISGTFDNPAGLACCLLILLPFAWYGVASGKLVRFVRIVCIACMFFMCSAIVLTNSRTAIICLILYFVCWPLRLLIRNVFLLWVSIIVLSFFVILYVTTTKQSSSSGRYFIVERTMDMIRKHPFEGYGYGGFRKHYMKEQESYFRQGICNRYAYLADDVRHPLNEFLLLWVNYGILGPVFLIFVFIVPWIVAFKRNDKILYVFSTASIPVVIFSIFSYPFKYPLCLIVCICSWLLILKNSRVRNLICRYKTAFCIVSYSFIFLLSVYMVRYAYWDRKWSKAYLLSAKGRYAESMALYDRLYPVMSDNPHFLYNCASSRYSCGLLTGAAEAAKECSKFMASYNLELLTGDICRMSKDYVNAERHYTSASYMCPSRFAPLYGLFYTYVALGDTVHALQIADAVSSKPIKIHSANVDFMKSDISNWVRQNTISNK